MGAGAAVALLRTLCVPVGSFRGGLDALTLGLPADSVIAVLGHPNRICTDPGVAHIPLSGADSAAVRAALVASTAERWEYRDRRPRRPIPRVADPGCRAPQLATELGFDGAGRLRWVIREVGQTPVVVEGGDSFPSRSSPP
ncbi:MAG: hypothetical protein ABR559_04220 [Gemmatimonadota bacterium]